MSERKIKVTLAVDGTERELTVKKISEICKLKDDSVFLVCNGFHFTCRETMEEIFQKIAETICGGNEMSAPKITVKILREDRTEEVYIRGNVRVSEISDKVCLLTADGKLIHCEHTLLEMCKKIVEAHEKQEEEEKDKKDNCVIKMYCERCGEYKSTYALDRNFNSICCVECYSHAKVHFPLSLKVLK